MRFENLCEFNVKSLVFARTVSYGYRYHFYFVMEIYYLNVCVCMCFLTVLDQ